MTIDTSSEAGGNGLMAVEGNESGGVGSAVNAAGGGVGPAITALADSEEYNGWDHETGNPTVSHFGNAIQVWAVAQNRLGVTVQEAAQAFNVDPVLVRQAVEEHPWMILCDDTIEHEGE